MEKCPCFSEKSYDECCLPIIEGKADAETAEALMRARYTAYTKCKIDFIKRTTHSTALGDFDEDSAKSWSRSSVWKGLSILDTKGGESGDNKGVVEFVAFYMQDGREEKHHERAVFKKEAGKWRFFDGDIIGPKPFIRETPKVGRNDPCPCNSGKKFKKCCGKSS